MDAMTVSRRSLVAGAALAAAAASFAADTASASVADEATWDVETDVVVVGFGGAGATAAVGAAEAGAKVILLEKAPEQYAGGNTSVCGGNGIVLSEDDPQMAFDFIKSQMPNTVKDEEIKGFCEEVFGLREWVSSRGGQLFENTFPGIQYGNSPYAMGCPGMFSVAGSDAVDFTMLDADGNEVKASSGSGASLFAFLKDLCEKDENIEIKYECGGKKLVFDPETKEVFGIIAECADGTPLRIKASRGIVLACGGFEANPFMMNSYYAPNVEIFPEGTPYNTGDGIVMLSEVGAKMRHFSSIEWGCQCCTEASREYGFALGLSFTDFGSWANSIEVNAKGERFVSECDWSYANGSKRPLHLKSQPAEIAFDPIALDYPNLPFYYICDSVRAETALMEGCSASATTEWARGKDCYTWSDDNQAEVEKGWIKKADTIEELADMLGIDPAGLAATVERYNSFCEAGVDEDFGRTMNLSPVSEPPFYGCEMSMTIINTQGGAERDVQHRALDYYDQPIPRLYTAGELGSIYGFLYQGCGNVAECLCGHFAGEFAAAEEPWA